MNSGIRRRAAWIGLGIGAVLTVFLWVNRDALSLRPWEGEEAIAMPTYAAGNGGRTAVIGDSEKSVAVLNAEKELVYRLKAEPGKREGFTTAKFVSLDEKDNLYILDVDFGGVRDENTERVLKYSAAGEYLGEVYRYGYINEDFILTKGKVGGMAYHGAWVYVVRLERDGFWLDRAAAEGGGVVEKLFFKYPQAFRDLVYCHINGANRRLTFTTKAGAIGQYDFNGSLVYQWDPGKGVQKLPWTAVSDNRGDIIYADILTGELVRIGEGGAVAEHRAAEGASPYYRINYGPEGLLAASNDHLYRSDGEGYEIIDAYTYGPGMMRLRMAVYICGIADIGVLLGALILALMSLRGRKINPSLRMILLTGVCIAFGAVIASVLIINRMNQQYSRKTFTDLENISRLITAEIDPSVLTALASPSDYDSAEYLAFKEFLTARFSRLQFEGERIYLLILMRHDTNLNVMCDLESSIGTYYPLDVYTDGPYKDAYESGEYVHVSGEVTSEGSWLFVCGPIFDREGRVIALIETGYNMRSVLEQTRMIVIQTSLIVIVAAVAFLLIIIEFIIIFSAYTKNKLEMAAGPLQMAESPGEHPFHPELLRALVFFLFMVNNLEAALLPMYAVNLYKPLFNLPKEFVVTLPIMADLMSAALALLIVPVLLELAGLKRISILAVIFIFIGNMLCFIADNTIYLTVAHVFTGFSGGALLLVINTIIGAQRDIKNVNSGFAHFNASYLAGVNVGVVLGSILAQFFAYRTVYLFSTILALMLAGVTIFSIRSKTVNYIYNVQVRREKSKGRMAKFLFNPVVIATLFFLVMPYAVSLSFTSYFMPIYSIENGLTESNIGQLILLNGLFAILFGTSLCGYVSTKAPIKVIIALSLFVNAGAIYLFSLNMSIAMLIVVMVILAMVNVFALTNIQTYYAVLYQNTKISSSKALGIYSAVENMSMAAGPVVFSYLASGSTGLGLKFVSGILVASLLLFILVSGALGGKKLSAAAGTGETSGTGETGGDTDPTGETSA